MEENSFGNYTFIYFLIGNFSLIFCKFTKPKFSFALKVRITKTLLIFFVAVLSLGSTHGANNDSLWSVWNDTTQRDSLRVDAMWGIARSMRYSNPDSSLVLCKMMHDHGLATNNQKIQVRAFKYTGFIYLDMNNLDSSFYSFEQGLEIAQLFDFKQLIYDLNYQIGVYYRIRGQLDKAFESFLVAMEMQKELDRKELLVNPLREIGIVYIEKDQISVAMEYLLKARKISEELQNEFGTAVLDFTIGSAYLSAMEALKSKEYFLDCKAYFEKINQKGAMIMVFNNLGVAYQYLIDYDSSIYYFKAGRELAVQMNDRKNEADFNMNLGNTYRHLKDYDTANAYYKIALEYNLKAGSFKNVTNLYFNIGSLYTKNHNYTTGLEYCKKSLELAEEYNYIEEQQNACECLRDSYKGIGDMTKAYLYQTSYYRIRDSLESLTNREEIARLEVQNEYDKQHLADSLAMQEDKLKQSIAFQADIDRQRTQRNIVLIIGIAILLFAIMIFSRFRLVRKTNIMLAEKNMMIEMEKKRAEESERSKEQFFNNISHEFKTPLTLIMGPLDKLLSGSHSSKEKQELGMMKRNVHRLYRMINELLNLYKLESGKVSLRAKKQDVVHFVDKFI